MNHAFRILSALIVGLGASVADAQIIYPNPINHVIVIDQENRTPDNLFGSNSPSNSYYLPTLDVSTTGLAYTITNGKKTVFNVQAVSSPLSSVVGSGDSQPGFDYDPGHSHTLWQKQCDAPTKTSGSNLCQLSPSQPTALCKCVAICPVFSPKSAALLA